MPDFINLDDLKVEALTIPDFNKRDDVKTVAENIGWKLSSSPALKAGVATQQTVILPSKWPNYNKYWDKNNVLVKNESSQTITVVMRAQQQHRTVTTKVHVKAKLAVRKIFNLGAGYERTSVIEIPPSDPIYHPIDGGKAQLFTRYDGFSIVNCVILAKTCSDGEGDFKRYRKFQIDLYKVASVVVKDEDLTPNKILGTVTDIDTVL